MWNRDKSDIMMSAFRSAYATDEHVPLMIVFDPSLNIVDVVTVDGSLPQKNQLDALNPKLAAQVSKFLSQKF